MAGNIVGLGVLGEKEVGMRRLTVESERRRFFRVDDKAILSCNAVTPEEKKQGIAQLQAGEIQYPDPHRLFLSLESDIQDVIAKLKTRGSEMGLAVELLNRKINLLSKGSVFQGAKNNLLEKHHELVNLSACGIAFFSEQPEPVSLEVQVELILLPSRIYLMAYGAVAGCLALNPDQVPESELARFENKKCYPFRQ